MYYWQIATNNGHLYRGDIVSNKKNFRMKAARASRGLSQADLAEAVGVTRQTIGLIESGGYNPTLNLCLAICKELRVTLDDLFWEGEDGALPPFPGEIEFDPYEE